jgi:hypothetical protein
MTNSSYVEGMEFFFLSLVYTLYFTLTMSQTELVWREISAQKAVNSTNFAQGVIDFNFGVGAPTAWIPSKSYFKIDMKLNATNAVFGTKEFTGPDSLDMTAFADHAPAALFNNIYFRAGGQDVSSLVNYVPQAAVARTRLRKSGAWQKSIGRTAYMCEANFQNRVDDIPENRPYRLPYRFTVSFRKRYENDTV